MPSEPSGGLILLGVLVSAGEKSMQQQLMQQQQQQQPSLAASFNTSNVSTDHIQQYLDENKALILKILENQNSGKLGECAENQARLQRNLVYLAAIADCQPRPSSIYMQPGMNYTQHHHSQHMASQSHMALAGQSPMIYAQQHAYSALQQQHALHSQLAISSTGTSGLNAPQSEVSVGGGGKFPDFGRSISADGLQGASRLTPRSRNEENTSIGSDEDQGSNSRKLVKFNSETT